MKKEAPPFKLFGQIDKIYVWRLSNLRNLYVLSSMVVVAPCSGAVLLPVVLVHCIK